MRIFLNHKFSFSLHQIKKIAVKNSQKIDVKNSEKNCCKNSEKIDVQKLVT